ncbi:MAG: hypothetical protein U0798_12275 [Gemmataceae bacterium]
MKTDRREWPYFVRLSLFGVPSRRAAWFYFWLCVGIAVIGTAVGVFGMLFGVPRLSIFTISSIATLGAYPYYYSIRWVDLNSTWN